MTSKLVEWTTLRPEDRRVDWNDSPGQRSGKRGDDSPGQRSGKRGDDSPGQRSGKRVGHSPSQRPGFAAIVPDPSKILSAADRLVLRSHLKEARREKALSQGRLAEMVGVSRQTISSIETGQFSPTARLALLLCYALGKRFEDLFYFDEGDQQ